MTSLVYTLSTRSQDATSMQCCNDPEFSTRQVLANTADPDQTAPSLHCCDSICTLWTNFSTERQLCLNIRVITAIILSVQKFRTFNVLQNFIIKLTKKICIMRKPAVCISEIKEADQLRGKCTADKHLCFRY